MKNTTSVFCVLAALISPITAIVGGSPASMTGLLSFPSIVSVQSSGFFGDTHICGGSIIGARSVLTAAHCCEGSSASSLRIRYGSKNRQSGGAIAHVRTVRIDPSYSSSTIDHDYCVLQLAESIDFAVGPSAIAALSRVDTQTYNGLPLHMAGWGKTSPSTSTLPTMLHAATVAGVPDKTCTSEWRATNPITRNMMCAAPSPSENQAISICNGDGGGPLMDPTGLLVVGIISFSNSESGHLCTSKPLANVFSDVAAALPFIVSNIM